MRIDRALIRSCENWNGQFSPKKKKGRKKKSENHPTLLQPPFSKEFD
jgi:hypothetical protein